MAFVPTLLRSSRSIVPTVAKYRTMSSTIPSFVTTTLNRTYSSRSYEQQQQTPHFATSTVGSLSPSQVQLNNMTLSSLLRGDTWTQDNDDESHCATAYCLSFAQDESDFERNYGPLLDSIMKQQLLYNQLYQSDLNGLRSPETHRQQQRQPQPQQKRSVQKERQVIDTAPLPTTLEDALRTCKSRAIVITERDAPFRIVNVNNCWEQLCGYSYVESKGKTLGSLLRGPKTDPLIATTMISKLLSGEPDVGSTIINYKKDGTPFLNRIRAGPLYNDIGQITHFVGILQEMTNGNNNVDTQPFMQQTQKQQYV